MGIFGAYYQFPIHELEGGPYWSDIKTQLGQPKEEYDPEASVSGSREPLTPDDSSDDSEESSDDWIYLSDIISSLQEAESDPDTETA